MATPPFVIHIFVPLMIHSFPFFSAFVLIFATSDPAPGSVTQYAYKFYNKIIIKKLYYYKYKFNTYEFHYITATIGSSRSLPRYFLCCSLFPNAITGASFKEIFK